MATPMGLEPTISAVTGRHVNHYTTGPRCNRISYYIKSEGYCQHLIFMYAGHNLTADNILSLFAVIVKCFCEKS